LHARPSDPRSRLPARGWRRRRPPSATVSFSEKTRTICPYLQEIHQLPIRARPQDAVADDEKSRFAEIRDRIESRERLGAPPDPREPDSAARSRAATFSLTTSANE
jgi:hypothetical protein